MGFVDGNTSGNDYDYDGNGNLTRDRNKGIDSVKYNHLNLPKRIKWSNGNWINYIYDASGAIIGYIYQYFYKDHLGNTRVTWSSAPDPLVFKATMETENAASEGLDFSNIYRQTDATLNKTPGGN